MKRLKFYRSEKAPHGAATKQAVSAMEARWHPDKAGDYKSLFIKEVPGAKTRVNKVIYIRREHHDRILKVVQIIGKNEVSQFSFLDNVLEQHFATYKSDITDLYEKNIERVF